MAITKGKLDFEPWEQIFYGESDSTRTGRSGCWSRLLGSDRVADCPIQFMEADPMREDHYTEIKEAIEEAGFFTTFRPNGDEGVWIVLVSHCTEGRLHGNSFRVSLKTGRWYLVTWSPAFYLVPPNVDLTVLCLDCLRASRTPIPKIPPDIERRYQLLRVSEEDYAHA